MVGRILTSLRNSGKLVNNHLLSLKKHHVILPSTAYYLPHHCFFSSSVVVLRKVFDQKSACGSPYRTRRHGLEGFVWIHSTSIRNIVHKATEQVNNSENVAATDGNGKATVKRKKLKGKRAVVRWLKFFRWKKKKDYERMTAEEKILYKLRKARNKETRLTEALKKIEPPDSSEPVHDPEILTPEEHFYFLKMGLKSKNYVPVGRRGIYQGVILNMHLHWKKHQTLKVEVKTFSPEEVKEIAVELARLSGGIVLDIQEDNTIIMYRGKNYSQPPTEIMSPKTTLPRIKRWHPSCSKFIPRLEQDLELLQAQAKRKQETRSELKDEILENGFCTSTHGSIADQQQSSTKMEESKEGNNDFYEDSTTESVINSESEGLSDIFETDSEEETGERAQRPLYLDEFEKFPAVSTEVPEDFEEQLRQISLNAKKAGQMKKDVDLIDLDEVDRIFFKCRITFMEEEEMMMKMRILRKRKTRNVMPIGEHSYKICCAVQGVNILSVQIGFQH
ncbi:hypothetical protein IFM89_034909 [Coptis chinensis]|uniref:CRM domain-containing protein n=1 Tax=Coptis chinensis TaxID=261450 RepID=A0A835M5R8_9MAGN|nr:hypothetical protein IFM89_034909 [Coptis chinensis]